MFALQSQIAGAKVVSNVAPKKQQRSTVVSAKLSHGKGAPSFSHAHFFGSCLRRRRRKAIQTITTKKLLSFKKEKWIGAFACTSLLLSSSSSSSSFEGRGGSRTKRGRIVWRRVVFFFACTHTRVRMCFFGWVVVCFVGDIFPLIPPLDSRPLVSSHQRKALFFPPFFCAFFLFLQLLFYQLQTRISLFS